MKPRGVVVPTDYAGAVLRWREHIGRQPGGLAQFDRPETVSTMLYACHRYLETQAQDADGSPVAQRLHDVKMELQAWMRDRGLTYRG